MIFLWFLAGLIPACLTTYLTFRDTCTITIAEVVMFLTITTFGLMSFGIMLAILIAGGSDIVLYRKKQR